MGNAGGPAMVVECSAEGAPDRPAAKEGGIRWPCASYALDPAAYAPVSLVLPPRADTCLDEAALQAAAVKANRAVLASAGMERFRVPPANLPAIVFPTVVDPSLAPGAFSED